MRKYTRHAHLTYSSIEKTNLEMSDFLKLLNYTPDTQYETQLRRRPNEYYYHEQFDTWIIQQDNLEYAISMHEMLSS